MSEVNDNSENTKDSFFKTLKEKVDHYFSERGLHKSGDNRLYFKGIFQATFALGLYIVLVFFTPAVWISIPLCILLGVNLAVIGFNVMHEGGHQSFSRHAWVNHISAYF